MHHRIWFQICTIALVIITLGCSKGGNDPSRTTDSVRTKVVQRSAAFHSYVKKQIGAEYDHFELSDERRVLATIYLPGLYRPISDIQIENVAVNSIYVVKMMSIGWLDPGVIVRIKGTLIKAIRSDPVVRIIRSDQSQEFKILNRLNLPANSSAGFDNFYEVNKNRIKFTNYSNPGRVIVGRSKVRLPFAVNEDVVGRARIESKNNNMIYITIKN